MEVAVALADVDGEQVDQVVEHWEPVQEHWEVEEVPGYLEYVLVV